MAKVLPDKDLKKLLSSVLMNADEGYLNPNGIELRLGKDVLFYSTGEELEIKKGHFLRVNPGETVAISSVESIDFSKATIEQHYPGKMLMGLITPTTTMMREGISQVATKIDAGFRGVLNWGLRNGSTKPLFVEYGEPIFKLTVFLLDEDETPARLYGDRETDSYQDVAGIRRSARRIPADIPANKVVSSSFDKVDPKKQLREAGYPFDHIGTELTTLHGKFEVVSKDVALLKEQFDKQTSELTKKIESETSTLSKKIEEGRATILEKVEALFDRKFLGVVGTIIGAICLMYGGLSYLQGASFARNIIVLAAVGIGVTVLLITYFLTRRVKL